MGLTVTTDRDEVRTLARRFLAHDPVRGTVLGSIDQQAGDTAWAAVHDDRLAIRSDAAHPVLLLGEWPEAERPALVRALHAAGELAGLSGAAELVRAVCTELGSPPVREISECLYRCDVLLPPDDVDGMAELAAEAHGSLIRDWIAAFESEAGVGFGDTGASARRAVRTGCWLWRADSGELASMAVRQQVHGGSARIGPVYTPPPMRGHGYGSAATAAATRDVIADDAIPVLFTDLANPTSNKIYQELGYTQVEQRVTALLR